MKIVVLDGYTENPGDLSWKELDKLGELTVYERTSLTDQAEAIARIGDAELIFTNKTPITREVLNSCQQIRFIGVLATGYNVVDVEAAKGKRNSRVQCASLWDCICQPVCHCSAAGVVPSHRTPR